MSQAELKDAIERARKELRERTQKIPASINRGSYNLSISYKEAVVAANKLLAKKNATYPALQAALMKLRQFDN